MSVMDLVKYVKPRSLRRLNLGILGMIRFMHCLGYRSEAFSNLLEHDKEISRLLVVECGFPVSKKLFVSYLNRFSHIVDVDGALFFTMDLEDFYHIQSFYEKATLSFILNNLSSEDIFVDVGANIGAYAVRAAKKAEKVYAFEPDVRNFSILEKNMRLNELTNVELLRAAVSDRVGNIELYISDYHGRSSIMGGEKSVKVNCVTLDSVLKNETSIAVIKIDVEGAEVVVLKGAVETLKKTKYVVVESNPAELSLNINGSVKKMLMESGFIFMNKSNCNSVFVNRRNLASFNTK